MPAIFDLQHTQSSDSIQTSLIVLPDPENSGKAVGISLLSPIRAEIYVTSYLLSVNDAILDLRRNQTSDIISISIYVLPDL